jgi:hypothetical protein
MRPTYFCLDLTDVGEVIGPVLREEAPALITKVVAVSASLPIEQSLSLCVGALGLGLTF